MKGAAAEDAPPCASRRSSPVSSSSSPSPRAAGPAPRRTREAASSPTSATLAQDVRTVQGLIEERITGGTPPSSGDGEVLYEGVVDSSRGRRRHHRRHPLPDLVDEQADHDRGHANLHEQGLFQWDDPVAKYIPAFGDLKVKDGTERARPLSPCASGT